MPAHCASHREHNNDTSVLKDSCGWSHSVRHLILKFMQFYHMRTMADDNIVDDEDDTKRVSLRATRLDLLPFQRITNGYKIHTHLHTFGWDTTHNHKRKVNLLAFWLAKNPIRTKTNRLTPCAFGIPAMHHRTNYTHKIIWNSNLDALENRVQ